MADNINQNQTNITLPYPPRPSSTPTKIDSRRTYVSFSKRNHNNQPENDSDGEPPNKMKRTAITLRDVQNLPVNKFVNLYNCIGDLHDKEQPPPVNLGQIVQRAWNVPIMIEACRVEKLNEVRTHFYFFIFNMYNCIVVNKR